MATFDANDIAVELLTNSVARATLAPFYAYERFLEVSAARVLPYWAQEAFTVGGDGGLGPSPPGGGTSCHPHVSGGMRRRIFGG